jgi:hypothetical protein
MKGELTRRYGVVLIDQHLNLEPRFRMGRVIHILLPVPFWHYRENIQFLPH